MGRKQQQPIRVFQPDVVRHEEMEEALRTMSPRMRRRDWNGKVELLKDAAGAEVIGPGAFVEVDFADENDVRMLLRMDARDLVVYMPRLAAMNLRDSISRTLTTKPPTAANAHAGTFAGGEVVTFIAKISGVRWHEDLVQITWHAIDDIGIDRAAAVSLGLDDAKKLRDALRKTPEPTNIVKMGDD